MYGKSPTYVSDRNNVQTNLPCNYNLLVPRNAPRAVFTSLKGIAAYQFKFESVSFSK